MREFTLRLQAQLDAHDAAGWYENQRFGLGMRFLDELDDVVNRIRVSPFQFPSWSEAWLARSIPVLSVFHRG